MKNDDDLKDEELKKILKQIKKATDREYPPEMLKAQRERFVRRQFLSKFFILIVILLLLVLCVILFPELLPKIF